MVSNSRLLSSRAANDLSAILRYYKEHSTETARSFLNQFEQTANLITSQPEIAEILIRNIRRFVMKGFPYHIYYIQETDNTVLILAILHNRRDPRMLKSINP